MKNNPDRNARIVLPRRRQLTFWLRLLTWGLLVATLAGRFLGPFFFLFELFSHFAVQYAILSVLFLIGGFFVRSWSLILVSVLSLLINGLTVRPWIINTDHKLINQYDVRVLHANVLFSGNDYTRIVQLVQAQSPDLFVLQEMTPESIKGVAPLSNTFPYQYHIWSKGPCHILVGSRTPIRVDSSVALPQRVISIKTTVRGREMALLTVHPQTPMLPSWFADRNQQLAFVNKLALQERVPTLLLGDFNISVFSPVYTQIFHRIFESNLTACRRGFGLQPTWPRFLPPMYIPIDHAFINTSFHTVNFQTIDQAGSDHKALVVDLSFTEASKQP